MLSALLHLLAELLLEGVVEPLSRLFRRRLAQDVAPGMTRGAVVAVWAAVLLELALTGWVLSRWPSDGTAWLFYGSLMAAPLFGVFAVLLLRQKHRDAQPQRRQVLAHAPHRLGQRGRQ